MKLNITNTIIIGLVALVILLAAGYGLSRPLTPGLTSNPPNSTKPGNNSTGTGVITTTFGFDSGQPTLHSSTPFDTSSNEVSAHFSSPQDPEAF